MQLRILAGVEKYARITTPKISMDVRLTPGMTVAESLNQSAEQLRKQAARLIQRAELLESAEQIA